MSGPSPVFDRRLLTSRRRRALARADLPLFLLDRVADEMIDRLAAVRRRFDVALDLATPHPLLSERLAATGQADRILRMDPLADTHPAVIGDEETLPFRDGSLDLVVSALALQFANDLPGVLAQVRRALRPDGLFLAALLGGETLTELGESLALAEAEVTGGASPRVAPFVELRTAGGLLQRAGFALPVIDQDRLTVRYDNALALMRDLRAMGAANALTERSRRPLSRAILLRAGTIYAERFSDPDGRVRATFDVIWLSGWAPAESQPKALRPGSARMRLADALGTVERPAGDKTGR